MSEVTQNNEVVLRVLFNSKAESYGYRRAPNNANTGKMFANAAKWATEFGMTPDEFLSAQLGAVDVTRMASVTPSKLFRNKTVCRSRCGVQGQLTKCSYNDYRVYYEQLKSRFAKAIRLHVPGWYSCADDVLMDFTRNFPCWFRLMEIQDMDRYSNSNDDLGRIRKEALQDCRTEPALVKLLKVKYGADSDDERYQQRIGKWL